MGGAADDTAIWQPRLGPEHSRLGKFEHAIAAGGAGIDHELLRSLREGGAFWPAEFVSPVVVVRYRSEGETRMWDGLPTFLGCATLIGGDLFLTARHVMRAMQETAQSTGGRPMLDLSGREGRYFWTAVDWIEGHGHQAVDLAVGKLWDWNAPCVWAGWAQVASLQDVISVGFPLEVMAPLQQGDISVVNDHRYLKGYVTRGVSAVANDDFAQMMSFETNMTLPPGMSGSPIWCHYRDTMQRALVGIAIGSRAESRPVRRETETLEDGSRLSVRCRKLTATGSGFASLRSSSGSRSFLVAPSANLSRMMATAHCPNTYAKAATTGSKPPTLKSRIETSRTTAAGASFAVGK